MERKFSKLLFRVLLVLSLIISSDVSICAQQSGGLMVSNLSDGVVKVTWNPVENAIGYHLEWTYVNSYGSKQTVDFRTGATRIETTASSYEIPVIYENGSLYIRFRSFEKNNDGKIIFSKWSAISEVAVKSHDNDKMNWQAIVDYTEEGKNKEVMTYYDGTMRARQMVTRNSTNNDIIVGETFYDHQGRAAIQALPVPSMIEDDIIKYHDSFNTYNEGNGVKSYDRQAFDVSTKEDNCGIATKSMSSESGSSKYYSKNNPTQDGYHKFIPDAEGYPFSQTEYTPDNTGRIRRQGGVGKQYQLGSSQAQSSLHPTCYYYGKPTQEDLWKLFGSQCGDFSHYQKNLVKDPNGSLAVSYIDMHGRTVATALAGNHPTGLEQLESKVSSKKTGINLLDRMGVPQGESKSVSSFPLLVTSEGKYLFNYKFILENINIGDICLDCNYLLTIDIKDECGQSIPIEGLDAIKVSPIVISLNGSEIKDCSSSEENKLEFSANLSLGNYEITRVLQVDPISRMKEVERYLTSENVKSLRDFIDEQIQLTDFTLCNTPDCYSSCLEANPESYEDYIDCLAECLNNEVGLTSCGVMRELMISDFKPGEMLSDEEHIEGEEGINETPQMQVSGGQYAAYKKTTDGGYEGLDYTIFSDSNFEMIMNDEGFKKVVEKSGVLPNSITNIESFVKNFKSSWAEYLAKNYHPEWNATNNCEQEKEMQFYQQKMLLVDTYDEAYQLGMLFPLGISSNISLSQLLNKDLFVLTNPQLKNLMWERLNSVVKSNNYEFNIWQLSLLMAVADEVEDLDDNLIPQLKNITFPEIAYPNGDGCSNIGVGKYMIDWDKVWHSFRSLYLSQRRFAYESLDKPEINNKLLKKGEGVISLKETGMTIRRPEYEEQESLADEYNHDVETLNKKADDVKAQLWESALNQANAQIETAMEAISGCFTSEIEQNKALIQKEFIKIMALSAYRSGSIICYSSIPDNFREINGDEPAELKSYAPFDYSSFGEVLESLNFTISEECNVDLITTVPLFGNDKPSTLYKPLDDCACDLIMQMAEEFEQQKENLPYNVHSAQAYFNNETGISIQNFNAKLCLCKSLYNGSWTEAAVKKLKESGQMVSADLVCDVCLPCDSISEAIEQYELVSSKFNLNSSASPLSKFVSTALSNALKKALTNNLNQRFNVSKTFDEYYEFASKCDKVSSEGAISECEITYEAKQMIEFFNSLLVNHKLKGVINDSRIYAEIHKFLQIKNKSENNGNNNSSHQQEINPYGYEFVKKTNNVSTEKECTGDCATVTFTNDTSMNISNVQIIDDNAISEIQIIGEKGGNLVEEILRVEDVYVDTIGNIGLVVTVIHNNVLIHDTFKVISEDWNFVNCVEIMNVEDLMLCKKTKKTFEPEVNECTQALLRNVYHNSQELYEEYMDTLRMSVTNQYLSKCFGGLSSEKFDATYHDIEHHYTLYYYDQAGNLVRTVPPEGVEFVDVESNRVMLEADLKNGTQSVFTKHRMETRYVYNSLNQIVYQYMPDHDGFSNIVSDDYSFDNSSLQSNSSFNKGAGVAIVSDPNNEEITNVYSSSNKGKNWSVLAQSEKSNFYAAKSFNSNAIFVGGANGTLLMREKTDNSWVTSNTGVDEDIVDIFIGRNSNIFYTQSGDIYTSEGDTWHKQESANLDDIDLLYSVDMGLNSSVAVGQKNGESAIYVGAMNNGLSHNWSRLDNANIFIDKISSVAMGDYQGYANGESGLLLKSIDGGVSWSIVATRKTEIFKDMCMVGSSLFVLKEDNGLYEYDVDNQTFSKISSDVFSIAGGDNLYYAKNTDGENSFYKNREAVPMFSIDEDVSVLDMAIIASVTDDGKPAYKVYYVDNSNLMCTNVVEKNSNSLDKYSMNTPSKVMEVSNVNSIESSNGRLYLNCNNAISCFDKNDNSVTYSIVADAVWSVNNAGQFVIAENNQLKVVDNSGIRVAEVIFPKLNHVCVSGDNAIVVGDNGVVFYSDDMTNFRLLPILTDVNLLCADFSLVNGVNRALIGGNNGKFLEFNNGRIKEFSLLKNKAENISSILLCRNGLLFVGTEEGSVASADLLNNVFNGWGNISFKVNAIEYSNGKIWFVGDNGNIFVGEY